MPLPRGISFITGAAFVALIGLICALAINGLLQLQTLGAQIHSVVEYHNRKIDLITQTQVAANTRADSLFRMALTDDPLERDALFKTFNRAGSTIQSGRAALRKIGLTPDEQRNFDVQTQLVNDIQLAQERIVSRLNARHSLEARHILVANAIPLQNAFNQQLTDMRALFQQANRNAQQQALQTYQRTFMLTLGFGLAAIGLGLLVAWRTLRRVGLKSREIQAQIQELERTRTALHQEATHDPLTGLSNRRLFYDRLQQAIRYANRYGGKLGILFVDLDRFKEINDQHGHHVGDAVLTEVAKHLTSSIRDSDSVARLGGDEFVVLLEGVQGRDDLQAAALKLDQLLNRDASFYGFDVKIAASIGQALYPDDSTDEDDLIRAADASMYQAKSRYKSERQRQLPFNEV